MFSLTNSINVNHQFLSNFKEEDGKKPPLFWVFHPVNTAIDAGIINFVATRLGKREFIYPSRFKAGFIYGGIAGITNIALRPFCKKIDASTNSSEIKAINFIVSSTVPWAVSAAVMHQLYEKSGRAALYKQVYNEAFRLRPVPALLIAAISMFSSDANSDLIKEN